MDFDFQLERIDFDMTIAALRLVIGLSEDAILSINPEYREQCKITLDKMERLRAGIFSKDSEQRIE